MKAGDDIGIGDWVRFYHAESRKTVIGEVLYLLDHHERDYFIVTDLGYVSAHMVLELRRGN